MNLTDYVKKVSMEDFGQEFRHTAHWNKRLKTTGGRFFPADGHLDFNPKLYEAFGLETFRKIVRHELCHYHLYYAGKGYRHRDAAFKTLLQEVGGLRYAPSLPQEKKVKQTVVLYRCQDCGQDYIRKRRMNTSKYRCGRCHGTLLYIGRQQIGL